MARKRSKAQADKRQLAALATLLALMQAAGKLSRELEDLAQDIGGSLDDIVEAAGVPFADVHETYVKGRVRKRRK